MIASEKRPSMSPPRKYITIRTIMVVTEVIRVRDSV